MNMDKELALLLDKGLQQMPQLPTGSEDQQQKRKQQLLALVRLLAKWNKAYNLTAVREPGEMVIRHILDSLSIAPYLIGERLLDVATGPGLPGLPLAILFPEKHFTLLDSNGKKTRFVSQACAELGLKNVDVVQSRVEEFRPDRLFTTITARAFSSLADIVSATQHLLENNARLLLMKGVYPEEELKNLPRNFELQEALELKVPMLDAERHLMIIRHSQL